MPESTSKGKILVIDDTEANRYTVCRILRKEGFVVIEAVNGREGLELLGEQPDLVIVDVRMPELDGYEFCRRVKADLTRRDIPILHVSATFTSASDVAYGLEGGADGYLTHPVDPLVLIATVRAFLRTRRAEASARNAAREWSAAFDAIGDGVCLLDATGVVVRCNTTMTRMLGRSFDALIGVRLAELMPEVGQLVEASFGGAHLRSSAEVQLGERWYRVTCDPAVDQTRHQRGVVVAFSDLTERRQAYEALHHSEERFRTLVTASGALVWRSNMRGELLGEIPGWQTLTGQGAEELLAETWLGAVHPDDRGRVREAWERSRTSGESLDVEYRLRRADGDSRLVRCSAVPLKAKTGEIIEWVGTITDIHERRQAEEQLRRLQRVETMGRLAGGIAHETNNQMQVVLGFAEYMLKAPTLTPQLRRDATEIRRAAWRVADLTRRLLAFGRRQLLQPEMLDLDTVPREAERMLQHVLGPAIQLTVQLAPGAKWVSVDRTQLLQVVLNLALNARDAMPGGGTLTLATRRGKPFSARGELGTPWLGEAAILSVTDTGTGIDPTVRPRIFEPFFTTKEVGLGSGLGLSVVEGIVEQSGGDIWVDSRPGHTSIAIAFPLVDPPAKIATRMAAQAIQGTGTLLVVEDENTVRGIYARALADAGYRVVEAVHGGEALQVIHERGDEIALVVTDIALPGGSGIELAHQAAQVRPELRFVFVSGLPIEVLGEESRLGTHVFLQKPIAPDELVRAVHGALERSKVTAD